MKLPFVKIIEAQIAIIKDTKEELTWYTDMEEALKLGKFEIEPEVEHNGKTVIKIDLRKVVGE